MDTGQPSKLTSILDEVTICIEDWRVLVHATRIVLVDPFFFVRYYVALGNRRLSARGPGLASVIL